MRSAAGGKSIVSGKLLLYNLRVSCSAGNLGHFDVPLPELGAEGGGGALGVRQVEVQGDLVRILRADLDIHCTAGELSPFYWPI